MISKKIKMNVLTKVYLRARPKSMTVKFAEWSLQTTGNQEDTSVTDILGSLNNSMKREILDSKEHWKGRPTIRQKKSF